jgi:hypothetical protein
MPVWVEASVALGPVFPTNGTPAVPLTDAQIAAQPNTDWLKFFSQLV